LFVAMLVVGGLGTFAGPLVGTALIMVISEYLRDYDEMRLIIVGVILLVTIVLAPRGLVPLLQDAWRRLQRWMAEDEAGDRGGPEEAASDPPTASGAGAQEEVTR